jgi:hypothetical protein
MAVLAAVLPVASLAVYPDERLYIDSYRSIWIGDDAADLPRWNSDDNWSLEAVPVGGGDRYVHVDGYDDIAGKGGFRGVYAEFQNKGRLVVTAGDGEPSFAARGIIAARGAGPLTIRKAPGWDDGADGLTLSMNNSRPSFFNYSANRVVFDVSVKFAGLVYGDTGVLPGAEFNRGVSANAGGKFVFYDGDPSRSDAENTTVVRATADFDGHDVEIRSDHIVMLEGASAEIRCNGLVVSGSIGGGGIVNAASVSSVRGARILFSDSESLSFSGEADLSGFSISTDGLDFTKTYVVARGTASRPALTLEQARTGWRLATVNANVVLVNDYGQLAATSDIVLQKDTDWSSGVTALGPGVTLDMNGHELKVADVLFAPGGGIVNSGAKTNLIVGCSGADRSWVFDASLPETIMPVFTGEAVEIPEDFVPAGGIGFKDVDGTETVSRTNIRNGIALMGNVAISEGAGFAPRRLVDSRHPLWMLHIDVWNRADPQKIIDLIPEKLRPYVCMNLSFSCGFDTEKDVYRMPQNAVRTYKSWASVCQHNGMWFTCQPASGGHSHFKDDDLETFEYIFRRYPNFLGWNYCEQFWGFGEMNDKSSSDIAERVDLFANLVNMSAKYGGFLTVSYCGGAHALCPVGMLKMHKGLRRACWENPGAMLWLYKYTTNAYFHNNESVIMGPFVSGLSLNYGVRYDNCGWWGGMESVLGKDHGVKYPNAAGLATVLEQTCVNGGATWDGPELIWNEDFQNLPDTIVDGFTRRNWGVYPGFRNGWLDLYSKIVEGGCYIPSRDEVVERTKVIVVNDIETGTEEERYGAWGELYDGLYLQDDDPLNPDDGHWSNNHLYLKKTGRYAAIPVAPGFLSGASLNIPGRVLKSEKDVRWPTLEAKVQEFDSLYPVVSEGDLYVSRHRNQLVVYTPYSMVNEKKSAEGRVPLLYSTCDALTLSLGTMACGTVREYPDHLDVYLNNYESPGEDVIAVSGVKARPSFQLELRAEATASAEESWDASRGEYTLRVTHNGPVDVSMSCSGSHEPSRDDILPSGPLADDPADMPAAFHGEVVIEAEDMDRRSTGDCIVDAYAQRPDVRGHAGVGFVEMGTSPGSALRHDLTLAQGGDYTLCIRYMLTSAAGGELAAEMNGASASVPLARTRQNEWRRARVDVRMRTGENRLVLSNPDGVPVTIDQVSYAPKDMVSEKFLVSVRSAEHGLAGADKASAAEGELVVLTASPDDGYDFAGWELVHGGVEPEGDGSFVMPDDNVTVRPIFRDKTLVYELDFKNVLTGVIPPGWRTTSAGDEVREYPNAYGLGPRTMTTFWGKWRSALYWRDISADYGLQSDYPLELPPGEYRLTFACAAWKGSPRYRVRVVDEQGADILSTDSYSALPNASGDPLSTLDDAPEREGTFSVAKQGQFNVVFESVGGGEFLLLGVRLNKR